MNLFKKIIYFDLLDSSNDYLVNLHKNFGISTPLVVVVDEQFKGKGQVGKKWFSDIGSLTFSFSIHVTNVISEWQWSMITSLAIVQLLDSIGIKAYIKYPNDIIVNNKKISGILTEVISINSQKYCIVGIGLNVNNLLLARLSLSFFILLCFNQYKYFVMLAPSLILAFLAPLISTAFFFDFKMTQGSSKYLIKKPSMLNL